MRDIKKAVQSDGGLYLSSYGWLNWPVGNKEITLDGDYTVEELEFIVAHIKTYRLQHPEEDDD